MSTQSEAKLEKKLIEQLVSQTYEPIQIRNEPDLNANFKRQLELHNKTVFTDDEFERILIHLDGGSVFAKAKKLRDRYALTRNNETLYIEFFNSQEWCKNIFQVACQIEMEGKYKNRYDVTILMNGLPLVQIELKRRGIELKKAFNQINRYQKHSYGNLFHYILRLKSNDLKFLTYLLHNPSNLIIQYYSNFYLKQHCILSLVVIADNSYLNANLKDHENSCCYKL